MNAPAPVTADPASDESLPRVSIIIPHLNTPELLVRTLQSLADQRIDHGFAEIIVVDNGSRHPLDPLARVWPDVRFLVEPTPGPGPARNMGVAAARSDYLAFIDADITACPGWLQAGLDALDANPSGPIGGDVRIAIKTPPRLTAVEAFESVFAYRQKDYIRKRHYSGTGNLMITRAMFEAAGPFDGIEHPEDRAFGERAWKLGMVTTYVPAMCVLHPARDDLDDLRLKWKRLSNQAWTAHVKAGRGQLRWRLRAMAVALSSVAHLPRMLLSSRVSGLGNRLRGAGLLVRLRILRALDMLEVAREAVNENAPARKWNR